MIISSLAAASIGLKIPGIGEYSQYIVYEECVEVEWSIQKGPFPYAASLLLAPVSYSEAELGFVPDRSSFPVPPECRADLIKESVFGSFVCVGEYLAAPYYNGIQHFQVLDAQPENLKDSHSLVSVSEKTEIKLTQLFDSTIVDNKNEPNILPISTWVEGIQRSIGGLEETTQQIVELIANSYSNTQSRSISKGLILSGKPGTGKTALARAIIDTSKLPSVFISCPELFQSEEGSSERYLESLFDEISNSKFGIVVLDELDTITSPKFKKSTNVEGRLFSKLIATIDSIGVTRNLFVIGITNRLHAISTSIMRSGRLDRLYEINYTRWEQRERVLELITKDLPLDKDREEIIRAVSKATHGFVPSDLRALCSYVTISTIQKLGKGDTLPSITLSQFLQALKTVRPSNLGEFQTKTPDIRFSDIFGMEEIIADLKASVITPFHHPEEFDKLGITPPRGVLVYGPPGVGKTMLCSALAVETGMNFILVESSQVRSMIVGESEKNIAKIFASAKSNAPCILFIDQIDILAAARGTTFSSENSGDRIVTSLLTATNRPAALDSAILRPGRLDQHIYVGPPSLVQREKILRGFSDQMPIQISTEYFEELCRDTEGFSAADLQNLCREAALICIRQDVNATKIGEGDLRKARDICAPSLLNWKPEHPY
ncbi:AAA-domain-containing protein [Basidiobolus meristosporus CBS 931.73]|uniref:AAA-domain-containing protein n=1 Tax=Basidiobolus meristosporus CBS 931.73 TaxID=1314790 RepID=A0A1Y1Z750_9FUNG|nr:AAA-domain-containing protein [Basidiobolus meristosporus CBS 931.73]|eukprot:ORY05635.1 AAA-domain-containing protein [Basidiobolus meristosporus CBS 931.73]